MNITEKAEILLQKILTILRGIRNKLKRGCLYSRKKQMKEDYFRKFFSLSAQTEKSGFGIMFSQEVEDTQSGFRVGSVIKSEIYLVSIGRDTPDQLRKELL